MKKILLIIKNEIGRQFAHRMNIMAYVFGNFLGLVGQMAVWYIAFQDREIIRGYKLEEMMSYIVIGWIIWFITTNYGFESIIARDIHLGTLTNVAIKPVNYLVYYCAVAIGRTTIAFIVIIFQAITYIILFHDYLVSILSPAKILIFISMVLLVFVIRLLISFVIGFTAFWTTEINGIYKLFRVSILALSGAMFPLAILPGLALKIVMLLPFAYTFFYPVQFYLGKVGTIEALQGLGIQVVWIFILFFIATKLWNRGFKRYESVGA